MCFTKGNEDHGWPCVRVGAALTRFLQLIFEFHASAFYWVVIICSIIQAVIKSISPRWRNASISAYSSLMWWNNNVRNVSLGPLYSVPAEPLPLFWWYCFWKSKIGLHSLPLKDTKAIGFVTFSPHATPRKTGTVKWVYWNIALNLRGSFLKKIDEEDQAV